MREQFIEKKFRISSQAILTYCGQVITNYMQQGLRLTLRQLYYQLVSANVIPNVEKSYKNLGSLISDARLAGVLDWDAIEDRVRVPRVPLEFENLKELVDTAVSSFRLPRWRSQNSYVELWVEKDALAGVLAPIAHEYHITLMVNRGYSSQSAMYESAKRFKVEQDEAKRLYLLYLGDHDPSGEDMVRDIDDRLRLFGVEDLEVKKIALTMEQVIEYNPPPNPAKMSDSRARGYVAEHGDESWEVDALPPRVLDALIRTELETLVERVEMDKVTKKEEREKKRLLNFVKGVR